jgi:hypothetical protein
VGMREVNDIQELTSAKSLDYECEGHWPLSVVLGDGTKVWQKYI